MHKQKTGCNGVNGASPVDAANAPAISFFVRHGAVYKGSGELDPCDTRHFPVDHLRVLEPAGNLLRRPPSLQLAIRTPSRNNLASYTALPALKLD
jgi:hypothetical protein